MKKNKAKIRITYPDGCHHTEETRVDVDIATDAIEFARWLIRTGESMLERARHPGMCGSKKHGPK